MSNPSCEYVSDKNNRKDVKEEMLQDEGTLTCAGNTEVVGERQSNLGRQSPRRMSERIVCSEHAQSLINNAELDWDTPSNSISAVQNERNTSNTPATAGVIDTHVNHTR